MRTKASNDENLNETFNILDDTDTLYVNNSYTGNNVNGTLKYPFKTITSAINLANLANHNMTIYIMNGTYNEVNMTITNNITISAYNNDNITLDALKKGYIFGVENSTLNLINLTLINGTGKTITTDYTSSQYGGVIYSSGNISIVNSNLYNNHADYGAVIYSMGNVSIINSTLHDNYGNQKGSVFSESNIIIINSNFINNTAKINGGAIYTNNLTMNHSSIINCNSLNGGAIYFITSCNIVSSVLVNNNATNGKIIYSPNGVITADYNWWGNNTPFTTNNNLININNDFFTPNNWIIMNFSIIPTMQKVRENVVLNLSLNNLIDVNGEISNLNENNSLINRTVLITSSNLNFNQISKDFNNTTSINYVPNNFGDYIISAKIDNQILNSSLYVPDVPENLYVNRSYTGDTITGSLDYPFKNITDAVNFANYANHTVTIYLTEGVYNDLFLNINNNISISSYNNSNVTLDALKKGYIFYVNENETLTLINLNLIN